jgi:GNAT superfamily N-acetyltransferase
MTPGSPVVRAVGAEELDRLGLLARVVSPFDPVDALALLRAAALDGARIIAAVGGSLVVGVAVAAPSTTQPATESLLALGVAPAYRRAGLGRALLRALVDGRPPRTAMEARVSVAERDVVEPSAVEERLAVARQLLAGAGFELGPVPPDPARDDPWTLGARLPGA